PGFSQIDTCTFKFTKHTIQSSYLNQDREFWVSLPLNYSDNLSYNVIYVFDAEWRFNLISNLEFDFSANNKIEKSIIVGIPHIDWEYTRARDLSFSQSRMEYDGEKVDSTWYKSKNAGGGLAFYNYLTKELMPAVESNYATNGKNSLIGHSMGGYFAGYILSLNHPFETLHLYDPSIWYSDGEVTDVVKHGIPNDKNVNVFITYQPVPAFHKQKIEELIEELKKAKNVTLHTRLYTSQTHNSLFLPSYLEGIKLKAIK
ncbi:alpha/beta hydrolase, partial [Fulvivirga sp. RKSG066]|uniref:alpha/beta hydrolase n=1 Tax=Fulvivirga aurantia TaxID=2529383 RepID=UPI0016293555